MPLSTLTLDVPQWIVDEDILLTILSDYDNVVPTDQEIARSNDGTILLSDPWTLTSASVDFAAQGVTPGRVARLTAAPATTAQRSLEAPGKHAIVTDPVASVPTGGGSVGLRRPGRPERVGQPFTTPILGDLTGITFRVDTLDNQVRAACTESRRRLRDLADDATLADRLDDDTLRRLNLDLALHYLYFNRSQQLSLQGAGPDVLGSKAAAFRADFEAELGRISARILRRGAEVGVRADLSRREAVRLDHRDLPGRGRWWPGL